MSIFWLHAPRWISTGIYLFIGWIAIAAIFPLMRQLSTVGFAWLLAGGILYSFGAIIYASKRPNPFPPHFGFHEIWHLFVLAGSISHFLSIATLI
jgi:hemolysin III